MKKLGFTDKQIELMDFEEFNNNKELIQHKQLGLG